MASHAHHHFLLYLYLFFQVQLNQDGDDFHHHEIIEFSSYSLLETAKFNFHHEVDH
jgi:hypothetical protein